MNNAQPHSSSAAAPTHGAAISSLELLEARQLRDALKALLRTEQSAMGDFLVALADFDRRRGWEALGHANLFSFLVVELRLSKSAAFYRKSAAELLQDFPEVIEPLREGRLCLSTIAELAKVLTEENRAVVAPRFFGLSAREAQELVAELQPRPVPSTRMVVTRVLDRSMAALAITQPLLTFATLTAPAAEPQPDSTALGIHPTEAPLSRVLTSDFANGGGMDDQACRLPASRDDVLPILPKRDEIVPLTANVRRVHFNVDKQVVRKLKAAREGLSRAIPGATMEQVLEAALDLLLEKQAKARGLVKKPRAVLETPTPTSTTPPSRRPTAAPALASPSRPRSAAPSGSGMATTAPGRSTVEAVAVQRTGWSSITSSPGPTGDPPPPRISASSAAGTTPWRRGGSSASGSRGDTWEAGLEVQVRDLAGLKRARLALCSQPCRRPSPARRRPTRGRWPARRRGSGRARCAT
jgi:hypothetical protein